MSEEDLTFFERPFWVRPPWKVLFDIVRLHKIRPWNVDISYLLATLMEEMGSEGYIDFSASGIALLSSAVIYRMKSEQILELQEPPKPPPERIQGFLPPPIQLPYRFEYTSTTIEDLINSIEEVLKENIPLDSAPKPVPLTPELTRIQELDDFMTHIERKIEDMYRTIFALISERGGIIKFSDLVQGLKRREAVRRFILILFLASRGKIILRQEGEFNEIYVSLPKRSVKELEYEEGL